MYIFRQVSDNFRQFAGNTYLIFIKASKLKQYLSFCWIKLIKKNKKFSSIQMDIVCRQREMGRLKVFSKKERESGGF